jgi:thioesterase domain-containing protein
MIAGAPASRDESEFRVHESELERYLREEIPLTRAMSVQVAAIDADSVTLQAPLAPNINHHDTVFGGSAAALAILAGWALLYVRLEQERIAARLVIQRSSVEYQRPIAGDFTARAWLESAAAWSAFTATLARRGRARISVVATLAQAGESAGGFTGQFVAFTGSGP